MDDISPLRQMSTEIAQKDLHLFESKEATKWIRINTGRKQPAFEFRGENPPGGAIVNFFVGETVADSAIIQLSNLTGETVFRKQVSVHAGINRIIIPLNDRAVAQFFPVTQERKDDYRGHLSNVIDELRKRVENEELLANLAPIESKLDTASSFKVLHDVRRDLVKDYAGYAGGQTLFGPKPSFSIKAGEYLISIALGELMTHGYLSIREDPLK